MTSLQLWSWKIINVAIEHRFVIKIAPGPARGKGIYPGGTLRGRQNHVSGSTGKYGIGLKKLY